MQVTIEEAINILTENHVVALPADTVYGLAANACSNDAVAEIYKLKNRPAFNPLIIHFKNYESVLSEIEVPLYYADALEDLWQKEVPVTAVFNMRKGTKIASLALAGNTTIACRIPHSKVFKDVLNKLNFPLAAPSANRSNHISPTKLSHVENSLGVNIPVMDGGMSSHGLESTIIDLTSDQPKLLRHGAATIEQLDVFNLSGGISSKIRAPGQLKKHYSPCKKVRLNAINVGDGEAILAFGKTDLPHTFNLSESGNLKEAAAKLFDMLYLLESGDHHTIAIMPVPEKGLGIAINDRLRRSSF